MTRAARCASAFAARAGADAAPSRAEYPERAVTPIVPSPPGGPPAVFAALLAEGRAGYARIIAEKHITADS